MEGAKNSSFGGMGRLRMVYAINEQRKAKDIREKDEFLKDEVSLKMSASPLPEVGCHFCNSSTQDISWSNTASKS